MLRPFFNRLLGLGLLLTAACDAGPRFERANPEALAAIEKALETNAPLDELVARYPNSYEVRFESARRAATSGNSALAIETFEELGADAPDDLVLARRLCNLCLFVGQLDRAEVPLARLLDRPQPSSEDRVLAARLARARGDLPGATTHARAAVLQDPSSSRAHHELALVLLESTTPDERTATAELRAALALDPGSTDAHFTLGTLLLQAGGEDEGRRALEASALTQELGSASFRRLPVASRQQRAHQIAARLPNWSRPWLEIARAELELGRPKRAEVSLARAAELLPDDVERYKLLYAAAKAAGKSQLATQRLAAWRQARSDSL